MSDSEIPGYKVLKKIAKGGMARVFVAIQEAVGRTIALKILPKKLSRDNSFTKLFLQEANCGVLNHPNILQFMMLAKPIVIFILQWNIYRAVI